MDHLVPILKIFDQFAYKFYPFLQGSPIDVGTAYDDSLLHHDEQVYLLLKELPDSHHEVAYRLFVSSVLLLGGF